MSKFLTLLRTLLICGILGFGIAYMCVRELDKDVAKMCGDTPYETAPRLCISWWEDHGTQVSEDMKEAIFRNAAEDKEK